MSRLFSKLSSVLDPFSSCLLDRSTEFANKFREEGNKMFAERDFHLALAWYNKSLCNAIVGSPQVSLIYANRSAVYLECKQFKLCLENIKLARDHGYPTNKLSKLAEREEKCLKMMEKRPEKLFDPWNFIKLSYLAHEKLPFMIHCLQLREDEKFGRHVVTTSPLVTGDIIAIEEPLIKYIDEMSRHVRCTRCLKHNQLSLIPCSGCTFGKNRLHGEKFLCTDNDCSSDVLLGEVQTGRQSYSSILRMSLDESCRG